MYEYCTWLPSVSYQDERVYFPEREQIDRRLTRPAPGATDNTRYGEGRASPRSFLTHHVPNISTAIQSADAQTILNAASARTRAHTIMC